MILRRTWRRYKIIFYRNKMIWKWMEFTLGS